MKFEFYIGGYFGSSYNLELTDAGLKCLEGPEYLDDQIEKIIVVDGNPEWQELLIWLGTRKWKRKYWADVCDGTQWKLRVFGNNIKIDSHGSNAYPPDFLKFLQLLNKVLSEVGIALH